jgi:WD40 repeat protein
VSKIFISHSSRDGEQAARLLTWLRANDFVETFLDFDKHAGLAPGSDWERALYREMAAAEAVILILTNNWFESKWCFAEFTQARALGKAIFPLIEAPSGETFVSRDIHHLDLRKDREGGLTRLAAELTEIVLNARGGFHWDNTRPPYPGLLAFDEADAPIYFGRDDDVRRLIERLNARRAQGGAKLVAVLGASGSGKSSLLRAGVLPRLKRDKRNWIVLPPFRPQLHPLEELAQAVAMALGPGADWRHWREAFAAEDLPHVLSDLARDLRAAQGANEAQILLTVDQTEELFGAAEKTEAEKFLRVINGLLDERLPFLAVMALRSDYLGQLQQAPSLAAPFEEFSLKPMPLARVRDIIEGPTRVAGLTVDDALVMAAMSDAATDDALPLLAFALRELYDRFGQSRRLTAEAYSALGDNAGQLSPLENAVRRKADEVLSAAKPSPEDLQALREAFVPAMVRVNAKGEYVRRPARLDALSLKARPLIERLAKARLLIIHQDLNVTIVEVTHEALLRKWPLLRGWLDEEREFLIGKDQLEQDLRDWEKVSADEKTEALLSGLKLTRARTWLVAKPLQFSEAERKFIQDSLALNELAAARRERFRRRVLQGSVTAALVLAVVAASALSEWRIASIQENKAISRQFAMQALRDLSHDPVVALREAIAAAQRAPTVEAEQVLNTVLASPVERFIMDAKGGVDDLAVSTDRQRIATVSTDGITSIWNSENGELLLTLVCRGTGGEFSPDGKRFISSSTADSSTTCLSDAINGHLIAELHGADDGSFSPDSRYVLTLDDGSARLWSAQDGGALSYVPAQAKSVKDALWWPNGKGIVTLDGNNTVSVWQVGDAKPAATIRGDDDIEHLLALSPDGRRIVVAGSGGATLRDTRDAHFSAVLTDDKTIAATFSPDDYERITTLSEDLKTDRLIVRIWHWRDGQRVAMLSLAGSPDFSPDGKYLVAPTALDTTGIFDATDGRLLKTIVSSASNGPLASFSGGDRIITAGSDDSTVRVWDWKGDQVLATLACGDDPDYVLRPDNPAAFSVDGNHLIVIGPGELCGWNGGQLLWAAKGYYPDALTLSPDGNRVMVCEDSCELRDVENGQKLSVTFSGAGNFSSAAFSLDGKRIVTTKDRTAQVWNAENGRLLITLVGHNDWIKHAEFSPNGRLIVTASNDKTARVWNAQNGKLLEILRGHTGAVFYAAFSLDSKRIVTAGGRTAQVWNAENGNLLRVLQHNDWVTYAEFSPDRKRILTASNDNAARIWDAETGTLLTTLPYTDAETAGDLHVGFSPDGKRVLTSTTHGIKLWRVDNEGAHELARMEGFFARFSPDGARIVAVSDGGTVRIYNGNLGELVKWGQSLLPKEGGREAATQ